MSARPILLVAEDDPLDEMLLRRAIQRAGLEVEPEFVHDGLEAVRYLERHDRSTLPALMLLDLKMPRMDGFGVLEWLQQHPNSRPEHVVVLSSCYGESDLNRSRRLGVDHYVVKPGDPQELAATVKRLEGYCAQPEPSYEGTSLDQAELVSAV